MSLQARILLFCSLLSLAGCGFEPLYAKKDPATEPVMLAGVRVDPITDSTTKRMGQYLHEKLEDRLNERGRVPSNPMYHLKVGVSSTESAIGVARDGTVSRYNVYFTATYKLYRNSDNKLVTTGVLSQVSSYSNVTNAYFSTFVAEQDAIKRGIEELAEIARQRLAAYLTGPNSGKEDKTIANPPNPAVSPFLPFDPANPMSPYTSGNPFTPPQKSDAW